jgi:hypothetical protein
MIVQSAPDGEPRLVITMAEHTAFAAKAARAFGNDRFEPVAPADEVLYMVEHHDAGWRELDREAPFDDATGLPYNLVETPFERIIKTSAASPEFNSRRHAYCGLLSSMHSWGLYNGRYGLSDRVLLDSLAQANRAAADRMLDGEIERQNRLKAELADDPATAPWIAEDHLMQNYKQLQFFDTLALYFNCKHEDAREPGAFEHVPMDARQDTTIEIEPRGAARYRLAPYPFADDEIELSFTGRYARPAAGADAPDLAAAPTSAQSVTFVAS